MYQCHIYKYASDLYTWVRFINMGEIYRQLNQCHIYISEGDIQIKH